MLQEDDLGYKIDHVELSMDFTQEKVLVSSVLEGYHHLIHNDKPFLIHSGDPANMEILSLEFNNKALINKIDYHRNYDSIVIPRKRLGEFPKNFFMKSKIALVPGKNNSQNGLYYQGAILLSQCEPYGFSEITLFPESCTIFSTYTVSITVLAAEYPLVFCNGVEKSKYLDPITNKMTIVYEDDIPKPPYQFSICLCHQSADFSALNIHLPITLSYLSSPIQLQIIARRKIIHASSYAILTLFRAMTFDFHHFQFPYSRSHYRFLCLPNFPPQAIEYPTLHFFDDFYFFGFAYLTLRSQWRRIERLIAHEFFHHKTGNATTCSTWNDLSLKEGLTVLR